MEFSVFLNNLSVTQILGMYSQGLFPNINILRVVKNHITEKIVNGSVVLSHDERRLYDQLMVSFMKVWRRAAGCSKDRITVSYTARKECCFITIY